ncbi:MULTISPECIES: porin [Mediterranea]|uniref:porin n=1 Tax=Mediterranea TaxID=1926659 RepID=UPI0020123258|nr:MULTISPECIES: porin [Mediterranea]MCL1607865.1 OprO/OprP family phosphate-selective porin [Mediterranea sp. ET5]MDM8122515.1 porin [Mediterranea massiliensis]MDM8198984.1 porin [Mediterranea massiliensis]
MTYKRFYALVLAALLVLPACAQLKLKEIASVPQFGGYLVGRAQYTNDRTSKNGGGFDLRMVRGYVKGTILKEWNYYIQLEYSGAPGVDKGVRLLDAYGEWKRFPEFSVKFGQMKRVFTFENPYSPWDTGFGNYSQLVQKLAGMSDRVGEHSSGGRDAGIVVQGDLFPAEDHRWLHYQVGMYNGQGINHSDENKQKDVIGGLWVSPTKELQIGAFGWTGRYTKNNVTVDRNRMAYGIKYEGDWTVRAEYATSQGGKTDNRFAATRADAWYVSVGAPLCKKLKAYAVWDVYRDEKTSDTQNALYTLALNYRLWKNLMIQGTYSYTDGSQAAYSDTGERSVSKNNYHTAMLQLYVRF